MIPGADKNRRQLEQLESMVESILDTAMQLGETVGLGKGDVHFFGGILMGFYDILCGFLPGLNGIRIQWSCHIGCGLGSFIMVYSGWFIMENPI